MTFLRNLEVKRTFLAYMALSVAATVAAFLLSGTMWVAAGQDVGGNKVKDGVEIFLSGKWGFGWFTLGLCLVFTFIYFLGTYRRYRRICRLSADIDRLLHGDDHNIALGSYAEGELGILQSEIYKMTVRLREQGRRLSDEKVYLADSIADIAHQIRTPLTSINLVVQFLSEPNLAEGRKRELIRELYGRLSGIDWLITALLKISKLDADTVQFQQEETNLSELIQASVQPLLVPMELRQQVLEVRAEGTCICDIAWTCEALTNIVKNCMEHTQSGGKIEVRATENALYSEIIISDNGSGFDEEDLPHVFERFYKGKNASETSFGIGLALARMIVAGQNGTIKVKNQAAGGAEFTIRFYKGII